MASCKDCLCVDVCKMRSDIVSADYYPEILRKKFEEESNCPNFKDRTRFVELPCKVGNDVWIVMRYNGKSLGIVQDKVQLIGFTSRGVHIKTRCHHDHNKMYMLGKTVFLTPEEAEKALNSSENSNSRKEKTNG